MSRQWNGISQHLNIMTRVLVMQWKILLPEQTNYAHTAEFSAGRTKPLFKATRKQRPLCRRSRSSDCTIKGLNAGPDSSRSVGGVLGRVIKCCLVVGGIPL